MAYETLITATVLKEAAHKPHYTPASAFKKAFKVLRKLFRHTPRHQKLHDESALDAANTSLLPALGPTTAPHATDTLAAMSAEERENYANELLEAAAMASCAVATDAIN